MHLSRGDSVQAEAGSRRSACCFSAVTGAGSSDTDGFLQWCVGCAPPTSSPGRADWGDQPRFYCGSQTVWLGAEKKSPVPPRHTLQTLSVPLLWSGGICANELSGGEAQRLEGDCCACKVQTLGAAQPWKPSQRSSTIWRSQACLCVPVCVRVCVCA